jgi:hypothetical protein
MKPHLTEAELKTALATQAPAAAPRPRETFWGEFRRRAADLPRHASQPSRPIPFFTPLAAAAAIALVVGVLFIFKDAPATMPTAQEDGPTGVFHAYEVFNRHRAVFILDDPSAQVAILWVVESKPKRTKGGDSI